MPEIGDCVTYTDEVGTPHPALVTNQFNTNGWYDTHPEQGLPPINLVFVSGDPARTDNYGRQTEHKASIAHKEHQVGVHGNFWMW